MVSVALFILAFILVVDFAVMFWTKPVEADHFMYRIHWLKPMNAIRLLISLANVPTKSFLYWQTN
jgi:hypothetical protein